MIFNKLSGYGMYKLKDKREALGNYLQISSPTSIFTASGVTLIG